MFIETERGDHGLPFNPLKACVVPRPIGWITTRSKAGIVNLAPFSFFNLVSERPPLVIFCPNGSHAEGGEKDSLRNVRETGAFVVNLATYDLRDQMNATAALLPRAVDEFVYAGLTPEPARLVDLPRVKESPLHLECKLERIIDMPGEQPGMANSMVLGRIVGINIADEMIEDGKVKAERLKPLARLGYMDYAVVEQTFTMPRPAVVEITED